MPSWIPDGGGFGWMVCQSLAAAVVVVVVGSSIGGTGNWERGFLFRLDAWGSSQCRPVQPTIMYLRSAAY